MQTLIRGAIALVSILCVGKTAAAASLFFQAVPTAATIICPAPCYQVQMFYEDPTGTLEIQALQVDMDVQGALVPIQPVPPNTNTNAAGGNVYLQDPDGNPFFNFPWSLNSTVGQSPATGFDVLAVSASRVPFSVEGLQETRDVHSFCAPSGACEIVDAGLAANRVYFGRFNLTNPDSEVFVRLGGITGNGEGVIDPGVGLIRLNGSTLPVAFPEPGIVFLVAGVLIGVALCRQSRGTARLRTLVGSATALAAVLCLNGDARAASLSFRAVPTPSTSICPGQCYQLLMFYEDATRYVELTNLQMDVDIQGALVAPLPIPPATSTNAAGGNVFVEDADGNPIFNLPFSISSTVGQSPNAGFDALVVNASASNVSFSVDSLQEIRDTASFCGPSGVCGIQLDGLAADLIYLGRFNIHSPGPEVFARVGGITGSGPGITDPLQGIQRLNGATFAVAFPTPEPGNAILLGPAIVSLALLRRLSASWQRERVLH